MSENIDKLDKIIAELRIYAGPVEHGAMAVTLHDWADRLATLRVAPAAEGAAPELFPGTRAALADLSVRSVFDPSHDEQWCDVHGMHHSVEMRDPDCEFPNITSPDEAAPQASADGPTLQERYFRLDEPMRAAPAAAPAPVEGMVLTIGATRCYGEDEWYREMTADGVTFLVPLGEQEKGREALGFALDAIAARKARLAAPTSAATPDTCRINYADVQRIAEEYGLDYNKFASAHRAMLEATGLSGDGHNADWCAGWNAHLLATAKQPEAAHGEQGDALLLRAYEAVHHDIDCPAIGGNGDDDCQCDAVPFLRDLKTALARQPAAELPMPEPLKQVAVAGYHDGVLKEPLEDYYSADQMRQARDTWFAWTQVLAAAQDVAPEEFSPKVTGTNVDRILRVIRRQPAAAPGALNAAMVERASLAYEVAMDGEVYRPEVPRIAMEAALTAALAQQPPASGSRGVDEGES
jgi:hypothetical protein